MNCLILISPLSIRTHGENGTQKGLQNESVDSIFIELKSVEGEKIDYWARDDEEEEEEEKFYNKKPQGETNTINSMKNIFNLKRYKLN